MILTKNDLDFINDRYPFAKLTFATGGYRIVSKLFSSLDFINDGSGFFTINDVLTRNELRKMFNTNNIIERNTRLQLIIVVNYLFKSIGNGFLSTLNIFVDKFLLRYFSNYKITKDDFKFKFHLEIDDTLIIFKTIKSIKVTSSGDIVISADIVHENDTEVYDINFDNIVRNDFLLLSGSDKIENFKIKKLPKTSKDEFIFVVETNKLSRDLISYLRYKPETIDSLNIELFSSRKYKISYKDNSFIYL